MLKKGEKSTTDTSTVATTTSIQPSSHSSRPPKEKEPTAGLLKQQKSTTQGESISQRDLALVPISNPPVVAKDKKKGEKKRSHLRSLPRSLPKPSLSKVSIQKVSRPILMNSGLV